MKPARTLPRAYRALWTAQGERGLDLPMLMALLALLALPPAFLASAGAAGLARTLGVRRSTFHRVLGRLQRAGLVVSRRDECQRNLAISVTRAGRAIAAALQGPAE